MTRRKRSLRWARTPGSTRQLILRALRRGWAPGLRLADYLKPRRRREAAQE